jgi:TonB family protein
MDPLLLALIVFSAQLLVIVSMATIVETLSGVSDPRLRLAYWRAVAGACLALPFFALVGPQASGFGVRFFLGSMENAQAGSAPAAFRPSVLATAFLRGRHLRSRLKALVEESRMSRRRLVGTAAVLSCVMASAIAGTAVALPLRAPFTHTQQVVNGKDTGVTLPKLISEVKPQYTSEALQARIQGPVMMDAVVRTDGTPTDIEVIRSLDTQYGLDKQAVAALSAWRFEPGRKDGDPVPVRITVEMQFTLKK